MKRSKLIKALKELLGDEYKASDWVAKDDEAIIKGIINAGIFHKNN